MVEFKQLHLIFPRSYHRYAWAFTKLKSVHMSRIQSEILKKWFEFELIRSTALDN